ncbi:hypothetical protein N7456_008139 [Penicillium angulare]|uniref:G-patch domain-containing protein n=1 Tax=Penicillium angulare TaxID=116970 RepID=A0A9W9FC14_9EURO|nr:hypothetical protein N7456_008139 [Penicillium angulare]
MNIFIFKCCLKSMAAKRPRAAFEADLSHSPYAFFGTPLPPLEEGSRDDGSYQPIWKQEVTDERGERDSTALLPVDSVQEGWTPATFVSSRQNRARDAKKAEQRAEDFMDEEDLREQEESRILNTTEGFAGFGSTEADPTRRAGFMDLLKTGGETMGVKLLKRMGWREGQGIGPKIRRKADLDEKATTGASEETYLFAPENPPMVAFIRKKDHKGLGFTGEAQLEKPGQENNDEEEEEDYFFGDRLSNKKKPAKKSQRSGFGVGILNDTGSDDEDPYSLGPQISYNKTIGGKKKKTKEAKPTIASSNPLLNAKPVFISKKVAAARSAGGFRKCRDGRLPLDGFVLADSLSGLSISDKKYEPPQVPEGWTSSRKSTTEGASYVSTADAAKASTLDPTSRAAALGEAQLPGKSIFDWMTPEARERIANLTGNKNLPPAMSEKAPKGFELSETDRRRDLWDLVPNLDKHTAVQALTRGVSGWMPYSEDENKRSRYRTFIEIRAGLRDTLPDRVPGSSTDEWVTEMNEFARAAEVFKPMSGVMASRFTSASSGPKIASDAPDSSDTPVSRPSEKPDDPAVAAAKVGMFGQLTRSTTTFFPTRLLCKRFNIKPPEHVQLDPGGPSGSSKGPGTRFQSGGYQTDAGPKDLVSQEVMNMIMIESGRQPVPSPGEGSAQSKPAPTPVEPEHNEAIEAERPGDDIFKAIFGSDDEDEE